MEDRMATEEEKRLHRCCFTGHRPEKLGATEEEVKAWLELQKFIIEVISVLEKQKKILNDLVLCLRLEI